MDVKKLVDDVGALLAPNVYKSLPEIAQYDLAEAGKCIAFERSTAAAFHVLRGTEDTLRHFYRCVVKRDRSTLLWGPMVAHMRRRSTAHRPPEPLLDVLDRIRVNFRNPTQHPDATYDIHEAQELFLACVEACSRMVRSSYWSTPT